MSESDFTFAFEEPPETRSINDPHNGPIVANLHKAAEKPGQWARVATYTNGKTASETLYALKSGKQAKRRPEGEWEFRRDKIDDTFVIYARLIPAE